MEIFARTLFILTGNANRNVTAIRRKHCLSSETRISIWVLTFKLISWNFRKPLLQGFWIKIT